MVWGGVAVVLAIPALAAPMARAAEPLVVPATLRLLVIAPHPDDESLGAGGLTQRVLAGGGRVHVLFLTSGDGYPEAVMQVTGHRQPTAVDYRGFGELRRAEALVALEHYRVLPLSVTFLGFPDGGLAEIWRRGPHVPAYESPYTREKRPPYPEAFDPSARYVSQDLIRQIARLVALADPDWIVVPTPLDVHPDHCATFTFVLAALTSLSAERGGQSKLPDRLLTYLVHSPVWPPSASASEPLPEPPTIVESGRWFSLALSSDEVATKAAALGSHRSQAVDADHLFRVLVRPNEMFGVIERAAIAKLEPGDPPCGPELPSRHASGSVAVPRGSRFLNSEARSAPGCLQRADARQPFEHERPGAVAGGDVDVPGAGKNPVRDAERGGAGGGLVGSGVVVIVAADDERACGERGPGVTPARRRQEALHGLEEELRRGRCREERRVHAGRAALGEEMVDRPAAERVTDERHRRRCLRDDVGERGDPLLFLWRGGIRKLGKRDRGARARRARRRASAASGPARNHRSRRR